MAELPGLVQARGGRSPHFQICAYDADRRRAEFFRSLLTSKAASDTAAGNNPTLADVIHAATTSPLCPFDGPAVVDGTGFWVGAVGGFYNPIIAAVTEALANGEKYPDIQVLSIGSATLRLPKKGRGDPRLMSPRKNLAGDWDGFQRATLSDPPDSATFVAHVALGEDLPPSTQQVVSGSVVRLCPIVRPNGKEEVGTWTLPDGFSFTDFQELARLDKTTVDEKVMTLVRRYGQKWVKDEACNQAIRVNSRFTCEVGHERFSDAKKAWWLLTGYVPSTEIGSPSEPNEPKAAA
jgi:hypothetical protein